MNLSHVREWKQLYTAENVANRALIRRFVLRSIRRGEPWPHSPIEGHNTFCGAYQAFPMATDEIQPLGGQISSVEMCSFLESVPPILFEITSRSAF